MEGGKDFRSENMVKIEVKVKELNIDDVVKYFVENSGMLFFYTKDDVKLAYDRIRTICTCENKYKGVDVTKKLKKLDSYYNFFVENFDKYSQKSQNKELFIEIMKIDSNIMFCGSEFSLNNYKNSLKKNLEEANNALFFFQKRYAVKQGMSKFNSVFSKIKEYRNNYGVELSNSFIDDFLVSLGLNSLSKDEKIIETYNKILSQEYEKCVKNSELNQDILNASSKKVAYIRDILSCFFDLDDKLEKKTLIEIYSKPLSSESEFYEAIRYFNLDVNCTKEKMIDVVESVIDDVMSVGLANSVSINKFSNGYPFSRGSKNNDAVLKTINYYKDILYRYFGVEEKEVVGSVEEDNTSVKPVIDSSVSAFSQLFDGLEYEDARKMYFSLMNNLLNSNSEKNSSKIKELEDYWNLIKDSYEQADNLSSSKPRR